MNGTAPSRRHRRKSPRRRTRLAVPCLVVAQLLAAAGARAATITVTGSGDTVAVDGTVTLREAILSFNGGGPVNADVPNAPTFGVGDTIVFAIPGAGVHTIQPTTPLPDLQAPMSIDGYTQPGASVNTQPLSDDAVLRIEIDGTNAGAEVSGLTIQPGAAGSVVRGLVINRFQRASNLGHGIVLRADNCSIQGNWIGTDATGAIDLGNEGTGVFVLNGGDNLVGGPDAPERNLISGNGRAGVFVAGSTGINLVQGNFVGTDATGTAALPNAVGIQLDGTDFDRIGGTGAGEGNVISGNAAAGVLLANGTTAARVQGNVIGADPAGTVPLPNGGDGVEIADGTLGPSSRNTIGSGDPAGANVIAFNLGNGIHVHTFPANDVDNVGNTFLANSIFDNALLGIDLGGDGVTLNDPCDADTGQNNLQNHPVIGSVVSAGGTTTIGGTLDSTPDFPFALAFFSSPECDPSGFGEGRTFLGFGSVQTDGSCIGTFDAMLPVTVAPGEAVTAIARPSDPTTDTSELSACFVVGAPDGGVVEIPALSGLGLAALAALVAALGCAAIRSSRRRSLVAIALATFGTADAVAATPLDLGAAFTVNTVTEGSQGIPAVAVNGAGTAVVVWRCEDPDLSPGICARRFSSTGAALGPELRVNTFTARVQGAPDVAVDDAGGFVVAWESLDQDGDSYGIYAQRFDAAGAKSGPEIRINVATSGRQRQPAVAMAPDGRHVVVWESTAADALGDAVLRRFAADGSPQSGEIVASTETQSAQGGVAVAMAADGRFVVAWETLAYPTGGGSDVALRRFDPGGVPLGDESLVHEFTQHTQGAPAVAMTAGGRFTVAWESFGQDGSDHGVYVRRFDAAAAPLATEQRVNAFTEGIQHQPSVAETSGGAGVVVWHDAERRLILARPLRGDGSPAAGETLVDDTFPSLPDLAADPQADLVLAWQDSGPEISARLGRLTLECQPGDFALCLEQSRYEVEVSWRIADGTSRAGRARQLTGDSGYYWFFDDENVEIVLKVLDACPVNGHAWVFLTGLTNVEVDVLVTHVASGAMRLYHNPLDRSFVPVLDTAAFASCPGAPQGAARAAVAPVSVRGGSPAAWPLVAPAGLSSPASSCSSGPHDLCLNDARFRARATYRTDQGTSGVAGAEEVTGDTGYFWFFAADNVEVVVKVLDACVLNDHYWVFAAGLTNVEVELVVSDEEGGGQRVYRNPLGRTYPLLTDFEAFDCD